MSLAAAAAAGNGERAPSAPEREVLLSVRDLHTTFSTDSGMVKAVDGISFDVRRGELLAIVGESGSGKSVTAMSIVGLLPTATITGEGVFWKGENLLTADTKRMRAVRGGEIAMIFQDPLTALNPVHTVGRQIAEMAQVHDGLSKKKAWARAVEMLDLVGIPQPAQRAEMHPHEFSGGMRQRAMIAMAITCNPDLLIADEPTTALDVTVQAQVLEVLMEIKEAIDSAIILITHDLGVVAGLADNVMVMYAGRQAEFGDAEQVFYETRHPYTLGLLASLPRVDDSGDEKLRPIRGAPPSLISPPPGCAFGPRCDFVEDACRAAVPPLVDVGDGHLTACRRYDVLESIDVHDVRALAEDETESLIP